MGLQEVGIMKKFQCLECSFKCVITTYGIENKKPFFCPFSRKNYIIEFKEVGIVENVKN